MLLPYFPVFLFCGMVCFWCVCYDAVTVGGGGRFAGSSLNNVGGNFHPFLYTLSSTCAAIASSFLPSPSVCPFLDPTFTLLWGQQRAKLVHTGTVPNLLLQDVSGGIWEGPSRAWGPSRMLLTCVMSSRHVMQKLLLVARLTTQDTACIEDRHL